MQRIRFIFGLVLIPLVLGLLAASSLSAPDPSPDSPSDSPLSPLVTTKITQLPELNPKLSALPSIEPITEQNDPGTNPDADPLLENATEALTAPGTRDDPGEENATVFEPLLLRRQLLPDTPATLWKHESLEDLLPMGAYAYLRTASLGSLLEDLDDLLTSAIPEKALPEKIRPFLTEPHPILGLMGATLFKQQLFVQGLEAAVGLAVDRPAALALYPGEEELEPLLALPVADYATLSRWIEAQARPLSALSELKAGAELIYLLPENPDLPQEIYLLPAEGYLFASTKPRILEQLLLANLMGTLWGEAVVTKALAQSPGANLTLTLSSNFLKSRLPALLYAFSPQAVRPLLRSAIDTVFQDQSEAERLKRAIRAHWNFGVQDLTELAQYYETMGMAAYSILHEDVGAKLTGLDGVHLALDLDGRTQRLTATLFHRDVDPARLTAPLPMEKLVQAVNLLPAPKNSFFAQGRAPNPNNEPSLWARMVAKARAELESKGLSSSLVSALDEYLSQGAPRPSLETQVDFLVRGAFPPVEDASAPVRPEQQTLTDFLRHGWPTDPGSDPLLVLPGSAEKLLPDFYSALSRQTMRGSEAFRTLGQNPHLAWPDLYTLTSRSQKSAWGQGVTQIVTEDRYVSKRGFLGFQEHELVNRRVVNYARRGAYTLVQEGLDPNLLASLLGQAATPVPGIVSELLLLAPAGASKVRITRWPGLASALLDLLAQMEGLAHQELDAYLKRCQSVLVEQGSEALSDLGMPFYVASLNLSPEGELYLMLPGGLCYPRPTVFPGLAASLKPVLAQVQDKGGLAAYTHYAKGELEKTWLFNSEALALLIKQGGNTLSTTLFGDGGLSQPRDGQDAVNADTLLVNPYWEELTLEVADLTGPEDVDEAEDLPEELMEPEDLAPEQDEAALEEPAESLGETMDEGPSEELLPQDLLPETLIPSDMQDGTEPAPDQTDEQIFPMGPTGPPYLDSTE